MRWAVLASDMHSFLKANPSASLMDFAQWYFPESFVSSPFGEGVGGDDEWRVLRCFWMQTIDRLKTSPDAPGELASLSLEKAERT